MNVLEIRKIRIRILIERLLYHLMNQKFLKKFHFSLHFQNVRFNFRSNIERVAHIRDSFIYIIAIEQTEQPMHLLLHNRGKDTELIAINKMATIN